MQQEVITWATLFWQIIPTINAIIYIAMGGLCVAGGLYIGRKK